MYKIETPGSKRKLFGLAQNRINIWKSCQRKQSVLLIIFFKLLVLNFARSCISILEISINLVKVSALSSLWLFIELLLSKLKLFKSCISYIIILIKCVVITRYNKGKYVSFSIKCSLDVMCCYQQPVSTPQWTLVTQCVALKGTRKSTTRLCESNAGHVTGQNRIIASLAS